MTIYIDVLIVLNIYVNYFLLLAVSKLTHTKLYIGRCTFASVIGSFFSLIILIPSISVIFSIILKLIAASIIVLLAFGARDFKRYFRMLLYFYAVNFIFAGVMLAVWLTFKPSFMRFNNTYFYFDFSLFSLIVSTVIAYIAVSLIRYFLDRKSMGNKKYSVIFSVNKQTVSAEAIADTGNTLTDIFTGKPVVICNLEFIPISEEYKELLIDNDMDRIQKYMIESTELKGVRLIPFSTLNSSGTIAVFNPDKIIIKENETGEVKEVNALVGIGTQSIGTYKSIFNPNLLL